MGKPKKKHKKAKQLPLSGTAMAVCLEKRSGKSDLTAVSSEE